MEKSDSFLKFSGVLDIRERYEIFEADSLQWLICAAKVLKEEQIINRSIKIPVRWDIYNPLCKTCRARPAVDEGKCEFCNMVSQQMEKHAQSIEDRNLFDTVLWFYDHENSDAPVFPILDEALFFRITDEDYLALMSKETVLPYLLGKCWKEDHKLAILVLAIRGSIHRIGDLLVMLWDHSRLVDTSKGRTIKFFFTSKGVRSLDIAYSPSYSFSPELLSSILPSIRQFRDSFSQSDIKIMKNIIKEGNHTKKYFIGKFLSLCSLSQKALLNQIGFFEAPLEKQITLLYLTRYICYDDTT